MWALDLPLGGEVALWTLDLPLGRTVVLWALSSGDSEAGGRPPINKSEKSTNWVVALKRVGSSSWVCFHIG